MALEKPLLDILVCPVCKGSLEYQESPERLICEPCRLAYQVENGIPNMLPDEAISLDERREPSA